MADKTNRDLRFKVGASKTDITAYLTSTDLTRSLDLIDNTALSGTNRAYLFGLAGATLSVSGMVNTTTDGIYGPLVAAATSVRSIVELRMYATNSTGSVGRFYNGSAFISNVRYSGAVGSLQTFSADHTFDGAVTRTSAQLT